MPVNQRDATCLPGTQDSATFKNFIEKCRLEKDTQTANTFLSSTLEKYNGVFSKYRDQFTDLIFTADQLADSMTGASMHNVVEQIKAYHNKKTQLKSEIDHYRNVSNSAEKTFLEDIYKGNPKPEVAPSLQDIALLTFWFAWLVMSLTLIAVRWFSPGGNLLSAFFTFALLFFVTLAVYGVMIQVA